MNKAKSKESDYIKILLKYMKKVVASMQIYGNINELSI